MNLGTPKYTAGIFITQPRRYMSYFGANKVVSSNGLWPPTSQSLPSHHSRSSLYLTQRYSYRLPNTQKAV